MALKAYRLVSPPKPERQGEPPKTWWEQTKDHWRKQIKHEWTNLVNAARRDVAGQEVPVDETTAGATIWAAMYHNNRKAYDEWMRRQGERFNRSKEGQEFKRGYIREEIGRWLENPVFWIAAVVLIVIARR